MTSVAAAFLAFSSDDSLLVRNAMRDLTTLGADAHAIVRLRLGLLTWVAPEDGEDALRRRLSRLQQLAEGWGETVFTPLVGDSAGKPRRVGAGVLLRRHRRARAGTAHGSAAPAAGRQARALCRTAARGHLFRSIDGKPLPFAWEDGEDYGFELIYGVPGRGKSVLMNSLGLAFCLQGGQARLPLSATIDIGPSSAGLISLIREALPPDRRHEAGWFTLRMTREHAINPCDTQLGCRAPLPAERAFLVNLLGLMMTPAGAEGVPDGMRELIGPAITAVYAMRSDKIAGAEPHAYTAGRDGLGRCGAGRRRVRSAASPAVVGDRRPVVRGRRPWQRPRGRSSTPCRCWAICWRRCASPAVQGLVGDTAYGAGGETVTQAFIRILTALSGDWPIMFAPTAFDIGACAYRRHRSRRRGATRLARGGAPDRCLLPAGPSRVDPALVDRRGLTRRYPRALPGLARAPPARYPRGAQASRVRRVPPHRRRACRARPGRARCARGPQAQGASFPGLAAAGGFRRRADRTCQPLLDPRRGRQGPRDRGAVRDIRIERDPPGRHPLPPAGTRPRTARRRC